MLVEVLAALSLQFGETAADGTLGSAGHALHIAERIGATGRLLGLDRDPEMLRVGGGRLREALGEDGPEVRLFARPYEEIGAALAEAGWGGADAVMLDLGINSLQLEDPERGFSFSKDGPLEGLFNAAEGIQTVGELVNSASEAELTRILRDYADERLARPIARRIVNHRATKPLRRTSELAALVASVYPPAERHGRIHPATRAFQALRIAANDEMGAVERGVRACMECLAPLGRLAVIGFHSTELRIVKGLFREATAPRPDPSNPYSATTTEGVTFEEVFHGSIECGEEEAARNPRARSAKLRAIRRKEAGDVGIR